MSLALPIRVAGSLREQVRVALGESDPPYRTRSRGRTAIIAAVVVFVATPLGVHSAIQTDAVPLRDPIYTQKFDTLKLHPEFFAEKCDRHRVIAIGSSRTQLCLDAGRLTNDRRTVFNFAAAGCGPVTDALYLRRVLAAGLRCETALVELHPAMLAEHPGGFEARWSKGYYEPFEAHWLHAYRLRSGEPDVLRCFGWDIETPIQFRAGGELRAAHTYRFALLNAAHPKLLPSPFGLGFADRTDDRGHVPGVVVKEHDRAKFLAAARAEYAAAFADYRPGGPAVAAVRDMLTQLQGHGIQPILLFAPESTAFRAWYGEPGDAAVSLLATGLAAEFGVPLIHARDWIPDDAFADGHHAMPAGAAAFTEKLNEELRRWER